MSDVKIKSKTKDHAIRLLVAADEIGVDRREIRATGDGFLAPQEVAEQAKVAWENLDGTVGEAGEYPDPPADAEPATSDELVVPEGDLEDLLAWIGEPEEESERGQRGDAVWAKHGTPGADELHEQINAAVTGQPEPEVEETKDDGEGEPEVEPVVEKANEQAPAPEVEEPKKNESREVWAEFAKTHRNATDEDLKDLGRNDIVAKYSQDKE